jgi:diguanylate cyclase (GGDEF)-like protein/PAS domain S-box-containing protein
MLGYGLLLLLSIGGALAAVLLHDRAVRYRHGQEQVAAIADGAERELRRELAFVDRLLMGLAEDDRHFRRTVPERAAQLTALRIAGIERRNPGLHNVMLSASLPDQPGLHATGGSAAQSASHLRIGHPRNFKGLGWVLPFAFPIPGAAAGEPGWVVGWLDISALEPVAANLELGSDGVANVMHRDGWMLVRSRDNSRWVGGAIQDTELFRTRLPRKNADVFDLTSPIDGTTRIAAYRVLPEYPLLVVAGISRKDALQGWGTFALTSSVLGGLLALLWGTLLRVQMRSRWRQRQLAESLQHSADQLAEARRIAGLGHWTWQLDAGLVTWSEEIYAIHGLAPETGPFRADRSPAHIHPDDRKRLEQRIFAMLDGGEPSESQYRIVRADGAERTIYMRGEWTDRTPGHRVIRGIQQDITELAEMRERLRQAEDDYRFLFKHNPLPMWVFDRETLEFLAINDAMLDTYGYSHGELINGSMLDIRPADDAAAVTAAAKLKSSERPQGRVWTHLRKDGSRLRAAIHSRDIEFNGRPARLVLALDVTERERSEERFQLVARATSDAVYDFDVQHGQLWWSDSFYTQLGYGRDDVSPTLEGWASLLHPDDQARVNSSLDASMADPDVSEWEQEYRLRRSDNSYADMVERGFLLRDEKGTAIRMVGGLLDLTLRHRHESDLRLLRRAVESTENGVVIADARLPDMPVVYVNAAFERISGYSADEVLGRNCRFLLGDDTDQLGRLEIRRGIVNGHEARAVLRNYRKDGEVFWNDLHVNPVRDDAGVITHFVGVQNDITERQRYQEQIAHRATHDELTGLPNRTLLLDRLQQGIAAAARFGSGVSVAFVDLDNFKLINDGLGHASGDLVLRAVAARLSACIRDVDTVGRFGGDEFVLVISEQSGSNGVKRVIERIEAAFAEPLDIGGAQHYLTGSIGYCCYPQHGTDAESLLMHADIAMYEAKQSGRNRAVEYRREFETGVSERLFLVSRLREALAHEEFVLHFQPLFRADGAPTGLEALVRWQHPDQGLLPPGRFISACENSGLIVPLGRWVLREAARHHALLAAAGFAHLTISINVSALQFQPGLLDDVQAAMEGHNLPRGAIEVELTESAVMADPEAAIAIMNQLDALGISVAVDDFGTGYSSLAYLKRLPIARLKIDQSFVRDLGVDEDDEAICASIIALARSLQLGTVAEGVETENQRRWLLAHGCDQLQGYLMARPDAFDVILATLIAERDIEVGAD